MALRWTNLCHVWISLFLFHDIIMALIFKFKCLLLFIYLFQPIPMSEILFTLLIYPIKFFICLLLFCISLTFSVLFQLFSVLSSLFRQFYYNYFLLFFSYPFELFYIKTIPITSLFLLFFWLNLFIQIDRGPPWISLALLKFLNNPTLLFLYQ